MSAAHKLILLVAFCFIAFHTPGFSHSGRLDSEEGHFDHETGKYHYHRPTAYSDTPYLIPHSLSSEPSPPEGNKSYSKKSFFDHQVNQFVVEVIDGGTIKLSNDETVRLIGVDTPETKHPNKPVEFFGKAATEFTKREIEGRTVKLKYEWTRKDKHDRTLAYVYRDPDNFFLNAEIIKQGYGHAYTEFKFKYLDEFREYEKEAREKKLGLWKTTVGDDEASENQTVSSRKG